MSEIKTIDGPTDTLNASLNISLGRVVDAERMHGIGERDAVNGNAIDLWGGPTNKQPDPVPAGFQPSIVSTSTSDTSAGTGAQAVTVAYIDTSGLEQEEVVTMSGTTPVNMVATDVQFVNEFYVSPGSVGSNGVAAGDITLSNGATVMNIIEATGNYALSAMRMVPVGHVLVVMGWQASSASAVGGKVARIRLRGTVTDNRTPTNGVYLFRDSAVLKDAATGPLILDPPLVVPELQTVKISAWTTGTMECSGSWSGYTQPVV